MILVIVESPYKCKTISKYLGKDYRVVASIGHIRDLAVGNEKHYLGVEIENHFKPIYEINPNKKKTVASLKKEALNASEICLATDPDREGEAISYHLAEVLNLDIKTTKRLEFHEITKNAIVSAINNPRTIDMNLVHSQETRRIMDRIIGFDLSHLMQKKINSLSAGRVQSVVLEMIVEREKEIQNFKEQIYYLVKGKITIDDKDVNCNLLDDDNKEMKFESLEKAKEAINTLKTKPIVIDSINTKEMKSNSYPVYTTSSLLQDAATLLKFDSKKTTRLAQKLYEGIELEKGKGPVGLITYMRTDSIRVSPLFISLCKKNIENEYGKEYVGFAKINNKNSENVQDAHEGIRPTDIELTPEIIASKIGQDEAKLYKLIYVRARASMMQAENYLHHEVNFKCENYHLQAIGEETTFDGYTKEYKKIKENKRENLPVEIKNDSTISKTNFDYKESKTKPKSRYSEATLIDAMKKEGIGRPSTYASTIDVIKKRNYVTVSKGYFIPTEQGSKTIELLVKWFKDIINIKYTSEMETLLDKIASDEMQEEVVLEEFYDKFHPLLLLAKKGIEKDIVEDNEDLGTCPQCGKKLVKRNSKYGTFIACSGYPSCKYIKQNQEKEERKCPKCHEGFLKLRASKYGKFYGCSNYPKCDYKEK